MIVFNETRWRQYMLASAVEFRPTVLPPEQLVFDSVDMRKAIHCSAATLNRYRAAGKVPRAFKLGGKLCWRADEVRRWIAAGMPDLRTWEAVEAAGSGRKGA